MRRQTDRHSDRQTPETPVKVSVHVRSSHRSRRRSRRSRRRRRRRRDTHREHGNATRRGSVTLRTRARNIIHLPLSRVTEKEDRMAEGRRLEQRENYTSRERT